MPDTFTEADVQFAHFLLSRARWKVKREQFKPTEAELAKRRYEAETDALRRTAHPRIHINGGASRTNRRAS